MEEKFVRTVSMPVGIRGITLLDDDWNYNIYINANLSLTEQQKALEHELEHIERNDWQSRLPVWFIESLVRKAVGE